MVLVCGTIGLLYINKSVKRDIQSGKKEIITGRVIEKSPRSRTNNGSNEEFYKIGAEIIYTPYNENIKAGDMVEVHITTHSKYLLSLKRLCMICKQK